MWKLKMPDNTPWPEDQIAALRAMWTAGKVARVIGEAIGRSAKAVQTKASTLKLARRIDFKKGDTWPAERIERLREMWAGPRTAREIAEILGVTRNAVIGMAGRLKLPRRKSSDFVTPRGSKYVWTAENMATLRTMWLDQEPSDVIASAIGMTRKAVLGKADRLGLPRRDRGTAIRIANARKPKREPKVRAPRVRNRVYTAFCGPPMPPPSLKTARLLTLAGRGDCKWPVFESAAGHLFCCAPVAGKSSYCREHAAASVISKAVRPFYFKSTNASAQSGTPVWSEAA